MSGGLTRVLSPDDVMGGPVWAEEVRQANNKMSEKQKVRRGSIRRVPSVASSTENLLSELGFFTPQTLTLRAFNEGVYLCLHKGREVNSRSALSVKQ